ncbi:MAG: PQQ-binding-like beta-propeller repeat protein, partial [bacterium]|nr:PQQ-binding-like beta-propeller repeat protein [bacterium]
MATRRLADGVRRATLIATILIACGVWTVVRMEGLTGDHTFEFAWRFTETCEERLLADVGDRSTASLSALSAADVEGGWSGFRGPGRDSVIPGVRIETDWSASAPIELWRRPIGPGWSSFAVHGNFAYTQEQRGEDELVTCYDANTGEPLWTHRDAVRFFDSMGGAGPRATPTLSDGRVYAVGATGILNVLDVTDGALLWSRNVAADTESEVPIWGFSSSPLVLDGSVIVAAGG